MKFNFFNFTSEHFLFIHRGKEFSVGISKSIENLFLEIQQSVLTPFTHTRSSVHVMIVSTALPDLCLRLRNKVKVDIFCVKF